jgi:hypothetical protein
MPWPHPSTFLPIHYWLIVLPFHAVSAPQRGACATCEMWGPMSYPSPAALVWQLAIFAMCATGTWHQVAMLADFNTSRRILLAKNCCWFARTLCQKRSDSVKRNALSNLVVFTDAYKNPHDFAIGRSVCGALYFETPIRFPLSLGSKINGIRKMKTSLSMRSRYWNWKRCCVQTVVLWAGTLCSLCGTVNTGSPQSEQSALWKSQDTRISVTLFSL